MHDLIWQMAQVQGEHMFLMHCWHYGPWWWCLLLWYDYKPFKWLILRSDLWCLHGDLRKDKKKYIAWILLMMSLSHVVIIICIKIIYFRIVLGTYMDEDCWMDTWMIIQRCIDDDRLFRAYVDWCRSSLLMILGPYRSGWLWCFSHMIEWFYIICKRMSWCGHTLMIHASCWSRCCWQILWSRS